MAHEMTHKGVRTFALVYGIAFLLIGIVGFIPGLTVGHDHPDVAVTSGLGLALGLFPVNVLHNIVHLLFGVWGLMAARSPGGAVGYARAVAIIYALFTVMGLISAMNLHTTFGLVPLYGNDVWLHALLALVAAYFGFMHRDAKTAH
ncbi:DUF4383 domain-containing protein [Caldimonas tepidiphila]|uniref:DUF4383 domain-containing protein n=1 Tax=Caldimonas tepidiphila TaxID=2315841 RepID=UPI001F0BB945|nr:DUF4383 domain-containing protein [Caldimonas tepidiphila]